MFPQLSEGVAENADALHLLRALGPALAHGGETAALARAARNWGARLEAPVDAVGALACLRDVVLEDLPAAAGTVHGVLDRVLEHAVDGATIVLRTEARTDPLTGCGNRLALDEELERAVRSATRTGLDVSVAVVDLDGLKAINDSRGHPAGDAALRSLVTTLGESLRDADAIYRIGGDEFAVLAPFTDAPGAAAMLERAARDGGPAFGWGVASLAGMGEVAAADPHLLVVAADADMYIRRRRARSLAAAPRRARRPLVASLAASLVLTAGGAAAATISLRSGHGIAGALRAHTGAQPRTASSAHSPESPRVPSSGTATSPPSAPTIPTIPTIPAVEPARSAPPASSAGATPVPAGSIPVDAPARGSIGLLATVAVSTPAPTIPGPYLSTTAAGSSPDDQGPSDGDGEWTDSPCSLPVRAARPGTLPWGADSGGIGSVAPTPVSGGGSGAPSLDASQPELSPSGLSPSGPRSTWPPPTGPGDPPGLDGSL